METIDVNCVSGCMTDVSQIENQLTQVISDTAALQVQLYVMQTYMSTSVPLLVYVATLFTSGFMLSAFYYIKTLRGE